MDLKKSLLQQSWMSNTNIKFLCGTSNTINPCTVYYTGYSEFNSYLVL